MRRIRLIKTTEFTSEVDQTTVITLSYVSYMSFVRRKAAAKLITRYNVFLTTVHNSQ